MSKMIDLSPKPAVVADKLVEFGSASVSLCHEMRNEWAARGGPLPQDVRDDICQVLHGVRDVCRSIARVADEAERAGDSFGAGLIRQALAETRGLLDGYPG